MGEKEIVEAASQLSKESLPAADSLPTMGEKEIVEAASQLSKESLPAADSLPTMGEKEIVEGSSQLSKESLPAAESLPTMGEKEIVEVSSQLSKESLPAADSLPTMGEKEIVFSVSSSLHGSQKPTVNKITSKGSLVQVQESSSSSSGLSSASRVLSEILKSWWNLKPKEFDSSAPQQLTPSQPQSFGRTRPT